MSHEGRGIPVRISPVFFLTAAFIGYFNSRSLMGTLIWVGVIFISILVHEYGHALFSKWFGQNPRIELTLFGGVTYSHLPRLSLPKEFLVVFAGPFFGFSLFLLAKAIQMTGYFTNPVALSILEVTMVINFIWTLLNLIPVLPLDGGHLLRIILEGVIGYQGRRGAYIASMVISIVLALGFIFYQLYIISVLFFLFAFQNFEYSRQIRTSTQEDDSEELKEELIRAERLCMEHRVHEAVHLLEEVREKAGGGMIYQLATQDLARVKIIKEEYHEAYNLLAPNKKHLSDTGQSLLHQAAFQVGDFKTVLALSGHCLVNMPTQDIVLRSAAAAASIGDLTAAMGWLQTARDYGCDDLVTYLKNPHFDPIRQEGVFQAFSSEIDSAS